MEDKHIVAVDIGSSKVALTIAKVTGDDIQVIYYGTAPSAGVRNNYVINSMQVTKPLEALIRKAENELNIKITQAVVGMPKYRVRQETRPARIERVNPDSCITDEEVDILKNGALDSYPLDDAKNEELFGAVAQSFSNGEEFQLIEDEVIGMPSDILEGNFKIFIGKKSALRAINVTFNNLKIAIAKKYFTPDVLAKAVLTPSETDNGVALIDFGGGSTSVSVYYGGIMRHYASIPFGGASVTSDIRTEAMISTKLAENIKLAFGACMPDRLQNLSEKVIQITSGDASPNKEISVKYLSEIITCRVREIIEAMLYEIERSGYADNLRSGIVLTGGVANLVNCVTFIKELSGYNVRKGYPRQELFSENGCDGILETDAAVSIGLILAAKADRIGDCIQGEDTVKVGEEVSFEDDGVHVRTAEDMEDEDVRTDNDAAGNGNGTPAQSNGDSLFAPGEIEEVQPGSSRSGQKGSGSKGGNSKGSSSKGSGKNPKITWLEKVKTLWDDISNEKA